MAVYVSTKNDLKKAIKNKEKEIVITDPDLAKHVKNFKKIKKLSKGSLIVLMAACGVGSIGLALAPATGGTSASSVAVPAALFQVTTASATISTGAIVSIGSLLILGSAVLFALWKDYSIEIDKLGPVAKGIKLKKV